MSDLIHWEETSIISGKQRDYPAREAFARAVAADLNQDSDIDPNTLVDKITTGWMRYCVGAHYWWDYPSRPMWHMGRTGGRGCTRVWVYDPRDEIYGMSSAMECPQP